MPCSRCATSCYSSPRGLATRERAVQISRSADQRQMRQGLRIISEVLSAPSQLLRIQPDVVGIAQHLLKNQPRLIQLSGACEALDEPERTGREGALGSSKPVQPALCFVAIHECVDRQFLFDRLEGGDPARIRWTDEPH